MKTLLTTLAYAILALAMLCLNTQASDPRRPTEATIITSYESEAVAKARQRPDVIHLRGALSRALTDAEKRALSASLYAIMASAAAQGRQAGLAAVEETRKRDDAMHQRWDADRRHDELIWALQNLRR
jgi:flagellar motor component MotA